MSNEISNNQNKSFSKGLQVLKEIMSTKEKIITANFLCQKLNIDKSTMSRLISTLIHEDFIEYKKDSKEIILSDILSNIVNKDDREKIIEKTKSLLDKVFYITQEASYLGILDNDSTLYIDQVDKSKRLLKMRNSIGSHSPLHSNAFGKILIAYSDEINIDKLILTKYTTKTITSKNKLEKEIELIRKRGYAIGDEEHEFGLKSIAVPYYNKKNKLIGTIGISGLSVRLEDSLLHSYGEEILKITKNFV